MMDKRPSVNTREGFERLVEVMMTLVPESIPEERVRQELCEIVGICPECAGSRDRPKVVPREDGTLMVKTDGSIFIGTPCRSPFHSFE